MVEIAPKDRKRFRKLLEESHDFDSLPIRTRLTDEEVAQVRRQQLPLPRRRHQRARLFRQYPNGEIASHVIGYIGRINDRATWSSWTTRAWQPTTRGTDYIGKIGLEERYETELHGITGFEQVEIDANGRAVRTLRSTAPVSGNNLLLSLDARLQEVAERAFGDVAARWWRSNPRPAACSRSSPSPASTRTCSSTASTRRTGTRSTIRPTSRSTTARCTASIRRARRSSRSWRWPRSSSASARPHQAIFDPGYFMLGGGGGHATATGRPAATAWSTCTSRS